MITCFTFLLISSHLSFPVKGLEQVWLCYFVPLSFIPENKASHFKAAFTPSIWFIVQIPIRPHWDSSYKLGITRTQSLPGEGKWAIVLRPYYFRMCFKQALMYPGCATLFSWEGRILRTYWLNHKCRSVVGNGLWLQLFCKKKEVAARLSGLFALI